MPPASVTSSPGSPVAVSIPASASSLRPAPTARIVLPCRIDFAEIRPPGRPHSASRRLLRRPATPAHRTAPTGNFPVSRPLRAIRRHSIPPSPIVRRAAAPRLPPATISDQRFDAIESVPSPTSTAILRVAMPPSPGSAFSDSGDDCSPPAYAGSWPAAWARAARCPGLWPPRSPGLRHVAQRGDHAHADCRHRDLAQLEAKGADDVGLLHGGLALEEQRRLA